MDKNMFTEGVVPGGIIELSDVKLLICYVLKSVGAPVSRSDLDELLLKDKLANYFTLSEALSELVETGKVVCLDDGTLAVTEDGAIIADTLEALLPVSVREKAVAAAVQFRTRALYLMDNEVRIKQAERGFEVFCSVNDRGRPLLSFTVSVSDELQAKQVENSFLSDPYRVYRGFMGLIIDGFNW